MKSKCIFKFLLVSVFCISCTSVFAQRHHHSHNHHPHDRYSKLPHWGYAYKTAPRGAYVFPYSGVQYYYHSGIFYKPAGQKYAIVRAPLGVRVRTLPAGNVRIVLGDRPFFYYYGTYYVKSVDENEYITVAPPVGARVDALPDGYKRVTIDEKTYYEFEGTYYKAIIDTNGEVLYEVVGAK